MANNITIFNADQAGFDLLVDGQPVPEAIRTSVAQGSISVVPSAGHALVHLELVCEHVRIEHAQPVVGAQ